MRRAGCAGIDFTTDSACPAMLAAYGQPHTADDIAEAVRLCRQEGITVMLDLLLGGPGETPATLAESVAFFRQVGADAVGAQLGVRIYPGTPMAEAVAREGLDGHAPAIRRRYEGPLDFLWPTFYISEALGQRPAALVRDLIGGDGRFFPPTDEQTTTGDHNYNDNTLLVAAIAAGARGAYWDILRTARPEG